MGTTDAAVVAGKGVAIYSVGHGTRTSGELLGLLSAAGVKRVVDVRSVPRSLRHPQFGRTRLAAALRRQDIRYVWRRDLGGWRRPRPDSRHTALRNASFRGYADYMETGTFRDGLAWLIQTSRRIPTAFLCAETLWWRCHRRLISDALALAGARVLHLVGAGAPEPHRVTREARVLRGGLLAYDRPSPEWEAIGLESSPAPP